MEAETLVSIRDQFDLFAEVYDLWVNNEKVEPYTLACVDTLAEIAGNRSALELGIGTGRVALPLAMKGVRVTGIDISTKMLDKLRAKEGADRLSLRSGNFADVDVDGYFDLIYVIWNTFYNLLTQEEQVRCVCNAARKLTPGGVFVVETLLPGEWIFRDGWTKDVVRVVSDYVLERLVKTDRVHQLSQVRWIEISEKGTRIHPRRERFVWPSELDLMAQIAGLQLAQRWSTWKKEPFTSESKTQISVYKIKD